MTRPVANRLKQLAAIALLSPALALAQGFPSKAVRIIVPFPAGGPADLFARVLAQGMSASFGQPVVIENRAGAGGVVGVDYVAKAPADGHTLALASGSALSIAPHSFAKMPYDVDRDLALLTLVVKVPEVLVTHSGVPARTVGELIAYAGVNAGKLNYGSAGSGSITHLAVELFKAETGIELVHIPYKGAAPAVSDMVGGQVQMGVFDVPVVLAHIRSGALRALAVTSTQRVETLPEVPTTPELGLPRVQSDNWYGLVAPAATPAGVRERIHAVAVATLGTRELREQYAKVSGVPAPGSAAEFAGFVAAESAKWRTVVRRIGFKAD